MPVVRSMTAAEQNKLQAKKLTEMMELASCLVLLRFQNASLASTEIY